MGKLYPTKKCEECGGYGYHVIEAGRRGAHDPSCVIVRQDCEECLGEGEVEDAEADE
jgi:DnaJ-class molecular chaperone